MTLVVDASVAVRWLFPLSPDHRADELVRSDRPLIAPDLVLVEITNAAWKFVRFEGHSPETVSSIIAEAANGFDELVSSLVLKDRALSIAMELRHPAYDCFYLALAEQRDCQVVTADDKLVARCAGTPFAKRVRPLVTARSGPRR
jgi:predicted nucleic acid-binding protein